MENNGQKIIVTVSNDISTDQRMERICNTLTQSGFNVTMVGRVLKNSLQFKKNNYAQHRLKLVFNNGPLFYLELNIRLFLFLLAFKPQLVYSVDADTALAGVWYKRYYKSKLVFDAHELFSEVPELVGRPFIKSIWKRIERQAILKSDLRITVSESVANYYFNLYYKPFVTLRNITTKRPLAIDTLQEKYVLYQGALNEGRGLEQLIEAAKKLDIKVKIAGDGDLSKKLIELANNDKNIEFLGKLSPFDLEKVTAAAWLGYNLLNNKSLSYYYSLSNKTFDYIQAGIPQLISDFPEYRKLNTEWGFALTVELDADKIVAAINHLNSNSQLYHTLKKQTQKAGEVLIWENEKSKLENAFSELLS